MLVLALDTCFNRCAACLFDSVTNAVVASENKMMEKGQAEALAPMVHRLFAKASLEMSSLDRLAVTTGPGTFTGVRIGLSFARALGRAHAIPVIGVDTLAAVALAIPEGERALIAHTAGRSGFAYVRQPQSKDIELWPLEELQVMANEGTSLVLGTAAHEVQDLAGDRRHPALDLPDLTLLAAFAVRQDAPDHMPEPVYIREAGAKPPSLGEVMLRSAGALDVAALAQLHRASFVSGWSEGEFTDMLAVSGTQAMLLDVAGQPAGFLLLRAIGGEAEILSLGVAPAKRRRGLARKLVSGLENLARDHDITKVFLEVSSANTAGRALYERHGFAETGLRKAYYSDGTDAVLMARTFP
jgi:tRNA threonylcarbamoyl adenosine modification protein YeaZ/ribosomal-protein-alanine acetyltransferase